jgi:uncharacterized protein
VLISTAPFQLTTGMRIEFLYSRNRLNMAFSQARCIAVIVASQCLLETSCSTID